MTKRRRKRKEITDADILDAAARVILRHGLAGASADLVAREAGYSGRTPTSNLNKRFGKRPMGRLTRALRADSWRAVLRLVETTQAMVGERGVDRPRRHIEWLVRMLMAGYRQDERVRSRLLFLSVYYRDPATNYTDRHLEAFHRQIDGLLDRAGAQSHKTLAIPVIREALVGAFTALIYFHHLLNERRLHYEGVEVDAATIEECMVRIASSLLDHRRRVT